MTIYCVSIEDYKEFFNEKTKINEREYEYVIVNVEGIFNASDTKTEFSVKWFCDDHDESGIITNINTSSIWALKSCSWADLEED